MHRLSQTKLCTFNPIKKSNLNKIIRNLVRNKPRLDKMLKPYTIWKVDILSTSLMTEFRLVWK
jgi:hypothetical protein